MMRTRLVSIACNNPDNGLFDGWATCINVGEITLEHSGYAGSKFTELEENEFRLSRRKFKFEARREWVGNWCWNGYLMRDHEVQRLLNYLRGTRKWQVVDCPVGFEKWWNLELGEKNV